MYLHSDDRSTYPFARNRRVKMTIATVVPVLHVQVRTDCTRYASRLREFGGMTMAAYSYYSYSYASATNIGRHHWCAFLLLAAARFARRTAVHLIIVYVLPITTVAISTD
jgi:hypothetical protein